MRRFGFRLPACEDDLWHEVVTRLLWQRDKTERQAAKPLRLLEEWAFHRVFCGRRSVDREWLERVAEWIVQTEPRRGPVHEVGQWIDRLEDWDFIAADGGRCYEFTIPTLDEYFAARHLVARWNDKRYREWLPSAECWWEGNAAFQCPNPECSALLPPFRELLCQTENEQTLLLMVGLLRDSAREEALLNGAYSHVDLELKMKDRSHSVSAPVVRDGMAPRHLRLVLQVLGRCRYPHPVVCERLRGPLMHYGHAEDLADGLEALSRPRLNLNREPLVDFFQWVLSDPYHLARPARGANPHDQARHFLLKSFYTLAFLKDPGAISRLAKLHALAGRSKDWSYYQDGGTIICDTVWRIQMELTFYVKVEEVVAASRDPDPEVRDWVIDVLPKWFREAPVQVASALRNLERDSNKRVQAHARWVLMQL